MQETSAEATSLKPAEGINAVGHASNSAKSLGVWFEYGVAATAVDAAEVPSPLVPFTLKRYA